MDFKKLAEAALEKRAGLVEQERAIAADTALTDAEKRERVERINADIVALEAEARSLVEQGEREAEVRTLAQRAGALTVPGSAFKADEAADNVIADFRALANGEIRELSLDLRDGLEFRTATTGTAGNAAEAHATKVFVAEVIKFMRERSVMMGRARLFSTSTGETLEVPRRTGVPTAAGPIAENTAIGKSDLTTDMINLGAFKYGVIAEATRELLEDERIGFASLLAQDLGEVIADKVNADLVVGNGASKPTGWVTAASAGVTGVANLAAVGFDEIISLYHSVALPYRKNGILLVNDALVASLRKKKDSQGQYLWQPSVVAGAPDTVAGIPVLTDPNIVTSGAGAKVAVYGDPSKYWVRQVADLKVVRSDEYGYDRDVIAFKATWRGDGKLVDSNSVKALTVTA